MSTVKLNLFFKNLFFYALFLIVSAVAIPLLALIVTVQRPFLSHRKTMRRFRRAISWYGKITNRLLSIFFCPMHYRDFGKGEVPGSIYVCNHRSGSDAFLLAFLPGEIIQVVNKWPFKIPVLGILARLSGYLDVGNLSFDAFSERAVDLLKDGVCIATFPEGTRSGGRNMGPFHSTIFRVALAAKCPIIPVCISGNEKIPTRSFVLHPGTIQIHKLPTIDHSVYKEMSPYTLKNYVWNIIKEHLNRMDENELSQEESMTPGTKPTLPLAVNTLIPQQPPMRMVDTLERVGEKSGEVSVTIRKEMILVREDGSLDKMAYLEMVAQGMAAINGFQQLDQPGQKPKGFLLGASDFKIFGSAKVGDILNISLFKVGEYGDFGIVKGTVKRQEKLLAEGKIKVWHDTGTKPDRPEITS